MEELPSVGVEFLCYNHDLPYGLYDEGRVVKSLKEVERQERIKALLDRASVVLKEVAVEWKLPLAEAKEEHLVLHGGNGRWGQSVVVQKVKWLGMILDEDLDFGLHWEYRIRKARSLLEVLHRVGFSWWVMSPLS